MKMQKIICLSLFCLFNINLLHGQADYGYNENYPIYYQNPNDYPQYYEGYSSEYSNGYYYSPSTNQHYYDGNNPQEFDWSFRESWRDDRKAFYSGETQGQAHRKSHPTGPAGIGYDANPLYTQMKNEQERLQNENQHYIAENNRLMNRENNQEYYSRGGGGSSQKGKASREARRNNNM